MRPNTFCSSIHTKVFEFFNEQLSKCVNLNHARHQDLDERLTIGHEICENLENAACEKEIHDLTFTIYEKIQQYLTSTEPDNIQESPNQQIRRLCLEIVQKIPNGEHLKPFAEPLLELLFRLVEVENEENVLICVKLIIDIHKFYRPSFSHDVTCFLNFVRKVYRDLKNQTEKIFSPKLRLEVSSLADIDLGNIVPLTFSTTKVYTQELRADGSIAVYHVLPRSCFSLKVMQEIPILVVLMYQLFKQHIHQDVSEFIPLIMEFINLKPTEEQKKNTHFNQDIFIDFMAAQVKTLSFLAYVIKIYQDLVEQHSISLVQGMMNLLVNCPPSVTNMRKEFFIAARHILSAQEIRPKFLSVLDELMDEDILIGQGYTVRDALRPLAYSTLADLIHHIRSELSLVKIARAIDLYGRNMHDATLPFSIQQMSLRLMLNLVECVRQRVVSASNPSCCPVTASNLDELNVGVTTGTARRLLLQTLRLCVLKAKVVADHYMPALEATCIVESPEDPSSLKKPRSHHAFSFANFANMINDRDEIGLSSDKCAITTDNITSTTIGTSATDQNKSKIIEPLGKIQLSYNDLRSLVKTLITGIRTIVASIIQCPREPLASSSVNVPVSSASHPPKQPVSSRLLSPDELVVLTEYFNYGMRMIDIVQIVSRDGRLYMKNQPGSKSPDERSLIETFALTFALLSPISFQEIFSRKIHDYVVWCRQCPSYTNLALHLLSHSQRTSYFGCILLTYLVNRLEKLGDGTEESALYMRLLKLCFSSVNMSGTENEHVMKLHLRGIVQGSMHYCLTAKEPTAYLTLLRTLFRSIGGGAHDKLYREFFPLLPEMLTTLNRLLRSPHRTHARDLLGELCVIVPVRLSTLLPYLSLMMEPLVYVLNCNTVNQGLRTLELCVDNVQPDFLHDHLYQFRGDMLLALYNSLHSPSEYVQKMSFKVLGKLGRFNRTNLLEVQRLRLNPTEGESGPQFRVYLAEFHNQPIDLSIRCFVDAAIEILQDPTADEPEKIRSWEFLQSICLASINPTCASNSTNSVATLYEYLASNLFVEACRSFVDEIECIDLVSSSSHEHSRLSCCTDKDWNRNVLVRSIGGLFLGFLNKTIRDTHTEFMTFLVKHLTLIAVADQVSSFLSMKTMKTYPRHASLASYPTNLTKSDYAEISEDLIKFEYAESGSDVTVPSIESHPTATLPSDTTDCSSILQNCRLDPNLLIDAIMFALGHEEKQLFQTMGVLLEMMYNTAYTSLWACMDHTSSLSSDDESSERVKIAICHLPLFNHLGHVVVETLHHPAWYVKWGGCAAIMNLIVFVHPRWFSIHLINFIRGLLYCIHDLSSQMSQGALTMAQDCARLLICHVFSSLKDAQKLDVSVQPTVLLEDDNRTVESCKSSKRPTTSTRKRQLSITSQRRSISVRRGRSASTLSSSSQGQSGEDASTDPDDQMLGIDSKSDVNLAPNSSQNMSNQLTTLCDALVPELLDALLSETDAVRAEARSLLRILAHQLDIPLGRLLAPHWRKHVGHILPPKAPMRLPDLPLSTQLVVLEANYFFGQSEKQRTTSKTSDSSESDISLETGGPGLLQYDLSSKDDRCFLSHVRSLLTQFDAACSGTTTTTITTTTTTTVTNSNISSTTSNGSSTNPNPNSLSGTSDSTYSTTFWPSGKTAFSSKVNILSTTSPWAKFIALRVAACQVLSVTWYLDTQKASNLAALFKGIYCNIDPIHEAAFAALRDYVSHTSIDIELRHANVKPILQNVRQTTNLRLQTARQLAYCAQLFPSTFSERLCDAIYSHLNSLIDALPSKQIPNSVSTLTPPNLELCAQLIDLFHLIPLATSKHVSLLIEVVLRAERSLNIEPTSPLRLPLARFLSRYPAETCTHLLTGSRWPYEAHANRIFLFILSSPQGQAILDYLRTNHHILSELIQPNEIGDQQAFKSQAKRYWLPRVDGPLTLACPRHLAIRVVHMIHQTSPNWLNQRNSPKNDTLKGLSRHKANTMQESKTDYHPVINALLNYWRSDAFARRQTNLTVVTLAKASDDDVFTDHDVNMIEAEASNLIIQSRMGTGPARDSVPSPLPIIPDLATSPYDTGSLMAAGTADHSHWDEPRLLLDCLLDYFKTEPDNFDLLFIIVIGVARLRSVAGLYPLRCYLEQLISESSIGWHRSLYLHFISVVQQRLNSLIGVSADPCPIAFGSLSAITIEDMYRLLAHLILPCLSNALERGSHDELIGGPPNPFEENDKDLVHLFITVLLDDPTVQQCTELRVMYFQMASLFVHHAPQYIHMGDVSEQSYRIRKITNFAWPCMTTSLSVVDLQEKYSGLQLLAHLIAKFNVARKATVQVFQCLAKGTHTETKKIVNPALDTLIPAWVTTPEDQKALAITTRKIMLEDHGIQSCIHILGIIVRHADLYYPIRHQLLPHIIVIVSRLSVQQPPLEQRRLALDMINTAAQWDVNCRQTASENQVQTNKETIVSADQSGGHLTSETIKPNVDDNFLEQSKLPMERTQRDQLINLMIRFACQAVDASQSGSLTEQSITRALSQLEFALRSDVWGGENCELRLGFIVRYFVADDTSNMNSTNPGLSSSGTSTSGSNTHASGGIAATASGTAATASGPHATTNTGSSNISQSSNLLMTLEVLRVLFSTLDSPTLLHNVKHFSLGLCNVLTRHLTNVRIIRSCAGLLRAMLERYPADASHRQKITALPELFDIYSAALKAIQDSFSLFGENGSKSTLLTRLQSAFLLFTATQVQTNPYAFVDRCIVQLVKLTHRLIQDVISPNLGSSAQESGTVTQLTDLLITGLEVIKSRLNVVSHEMRKNAFGPDLCLIMDRARDPRLFRAVIQILRDWINVPKSEEHFAPTAKEKVNFFYHLWQAYPRWVDLAPEVSKEILECIYDVYINGSVFKNHDLYVKLEQAFCCGLISPFSEIREKFLAVYLEASQLRFPCSNQSNRRCELATGSVHSGTTDVTHSDSMNSITECDTGANEPSYSSASLIIRLLFLLVSCNWDEAHFRDGFWLPLFIDVLLCDVDTQLPPMLAPDSGHFIGPDMNSSSINRTVTTTCDTPDLNWVNQIEKSTTDSGLHDFNVLVQSQTKTFTDIQKISVGLGFRGLMSLAHRRPALANLMFAQLWPQLWDRILLHQSGLQLSCSSPIVDEFDTNNTISSHESNHCQTLSNQNTNFTCTIDSSGGDATIFTGHGLSANEVKSFVIPQLIRFLTSDQHVHPSEPQPSSLGAFVSALLSTPDTLLSYLPLPAITYMGYTHNQWHSVALYLESLCANARKSTKNLMANDLTYCLTTSCGETNYMTHAHVSQHLGLPSGAASLSLIALYDNMVDVDFLTAAWWYRLAPNNNNSDASSDHPLDATHCQNMLTCLEYAQHGYLLRALDTSLDNLSITSFPSTTTAVNALESSGSGSSASSNRAAAAAAASASARSLQTSNLPPVHPAVQLGELVNRTRLQDYCIRYLKQLGQWDSLESLASSAQSASYLTGPFGVNNPGSAGTAGTPGGSGGTGSGGSGYWGLKADAAWRRSDWSEVYCSLAKLANECPRSELPRYALIQGAACVAGRRASGLAAAAAADLDSYSSGLVSNELTSPINSVCTPASTTGSSTATTTSPHSVSGASTPVSNVVSMIQASELENHRIVSTVLKEWRRLPLIISVQHVPLLQASHRAVEITEGNSLLAQYCGHVLAGPCVGQGLPSAYSSPNQISSGSSTPGPQSSSGTSNPTSSSVNMRMPLNQALHDYKNVFKHWQSRPCSIGDDLGFWHDLLSWRQVVEESIISCHPYTHKYSSERGNLLAFCQRELALSQLKLARGARKYRFPSIAQQHLDRYTRMNLPPLFEKTKQEIKLKMIDLRKDELLEGLELMEKTNIQQYEKKDQAKFFCYKAVFFSHFNKGDEATKNFGYATQMQDNIHKVWSIYGDFLENVYSSYPSAKREVAVSTTGIFAMQTLMEAASVAGSLERKCRADIAKCLWLLTLDDVNGQQRLARTFEERASRVRPEVFIPWLPNLVASLLRPEGRFIVPALRGLASSHPTVLYDHLRGLQHQLASEVMNDEKLGEIVQASCEKSAFAQSLRARVSGALGLKGNSSLKGCGKFRSSTQSDKTVLSPSVYRPDCTYSSITGASASCTTASKMTGFGSSHSYSGVNSGANTSSVSGNTPLNSKKKKRVIVVMRGVEGERLSTSPNSPQQCKSNMNASQSAGQPKKVVIRSPDIDTPTGLEHGQLDDMADEADDVEMDDDVDPFDPNREEDDELGPSDDIGLTDSNPDTNISSVDNDAEFNFAGLESGRSSAGPETTSYSEVEHFKGGTGCISYSVLDGLHRLNVLISQLRRRHAARIYAVDAFIMEITGRLQPHWTEQLMAQLCTVLNYLHRFAWAAIRPNESWQLDKLCSSPIPDWLATELAQIGQTCGLPRTCFYSQTDPDVLTTSAGLLSSQVPESSPLSSSESDKDDTKPSMTKTKASSSKSNKTRSYSKDLTASGDGSYKIGRATIKNSPSTICTIAPVFQEASQLAADNMWTEAENDLCYKLIRSQLSKEMSNLNNYTILHVIKQLTLRWIPLVEQHVSKLPIRTQVTDHGARRLLELPNLVTCLPSGNLTSFGNSSTNTYPSIATMLPSLPCLELPGESGLFQATSGLLNPPNSSHLHGQNDNSGQPGGYFANAPLQLYIAEILPHLVRIRCSPSSNGSPARRMGIRASNGRVFFYDLACLGLPHSLGPAAMQLDALSGALSKHISGLFDSETSDLEHLTLEGLCSTAYSGWRQNGPLQLFQIINSFIASQPATVKRNLMLFIPRRMEVGPMGLYLIQIGSSAPAASVGLASSCPHPSANPVTSSHLTSLTRPPPVLSGNTSSHNKQPIASLLKDSNFLYSLTFTDVQPNVNQQSTEKKDRDQYKSKPRLPSPPPGPLPNLITSQTTFNSNMMVGGSAAVAAEAIGRPAGLDTGCHPACTSLVGVLEQTASSWLHGKSSKHPSTNVALKNDPNDLSGIKTEQKSSTDSIGISKSTSIPPLGARASVHVFYDRLSESSDLEQAEIKTLCKIFHEISLRMPHHANLQSTMSHGAQNPNFSDSDEQNFESMAEFPRSNLLKSWAENRMLDAESYWLFRRTFASHLGLIMLMEHLFHLTPVHPASLLMDPRSGHAEARHVRFDLPTDSGSIDQVSVTSNTDSLASHFVQSMGIFKSKRSDNNEDDWFIHARPVPFRLSPSLTGFICLPGAPATVGPFAASFTTTAQALMVTQRTHALNSLYRTILRGDYILWHRGRQAAVHANQLLMSETSSSESHINPIKMETRDSGTLVEGSEKSLDSKSTITGNTKPSLTTHDTDGLPPSILVPDLTNDQLIQLIGLTMEASNTKLRTTSDYTGSEPRSWELIRAATKPSGLVQLDPALLPWL